MVRGKSSCWITLFITSRIVCWCAYSTIRGILPLLIGICRRVTIVKVCVEGIWQIFEDRLVIVIYTGHSIFWQGKLKRCVLSNMIIMATSVSPSLSIFLTSISTLLSSGISADLCLTPPAPSVLFSIEVFWLCITVKATLSGQNEMIGVSPLLDVPSHATDNV